MIRRTYLSLLICSIVLCTPLTAYTYTALNNTQEILALVRSHPNKTIILSMFASFCTACRNEVPILNKIQSNFKSSAVIYGLSLDMHTEPLETFVRETNLQYTVYTIPYTVAQDLGIEIIPQLFIYKDALLIKHIVGLISYDELVQYIR